MVRSPLTAARATFALKAGEWFRRGRLLMVSPVHGDYRRYQAEIPLIALSKFPRPALTTTAYLALPRRRIDCSKGSTLAQTSAAGATALISSSRRAAAIL